MKSAQLPRGTVTMLFTDIEGSTRLLEELGESYAEALGEHRRLLRAAFDRHGGVEVDTQGDSFFVVFSTASAALAAATEGQSALADGGRVNVRMGLHTGEPVLSQEGYVGMDVHRAARLAAAGHGGQVLLSQTTFDLVDPKGLTDLGTHRLKDVGELHIFQVGDAAFPPLTTLHPTNLPTPLTPFLGRERERAQALRLIKLEGARLLTFTGPGGIGKTRLAIELVAGLIDDFRDGVWFVDLSSITEPELLEQTIGAALGAPIELSAHLRERELLLVLDNFEQIVEAAETLGRLLEACSGIVLVVTSREALRLRGEREFALQPLHDEASKELFVQRARSIAPGFDAEQDLLGELCRLLDGIPLAIELAAARVVILEPAQLVSRLDRRLQLLTSGARDLPQRQRTLRATIEWSHDLLSPDERQLFARLAVFVGGWTLDGADAVCDAALDTLQALVDKSLIRSEQGRFRMLETIREFALERFDLSDDGDDVRRRHAMFYAELALQAGPLLTGPEQHIWLERLAAEYDNLRSALEWTTTTPGEATRALDLASGLAMFWFVRALYHDGLLWLERVIALSQGDRSQARAGVLWGAGLISAVVGLEERSRTLANECLELAQSLGDVSKTARSLGVMGLVAFFRSDLQEARASFEESIEFARKAGDAWCLADSLGTIGSIYPLLGEFDRSKSAAAEALEIARHTDDRQGTRMALFALGIADSRQGHIDEARQEAEEGLAICREIGDVFFASYFLWMLALVRIDAGELEPAGACAEEALDLAEEVGAPLLIACALEALAGVARAEGKPDEALLLRAREVGRGGMVPSSYLATVLRRLGESAAAGGASSPANEYFQESISVAKSVGDTWGVGRTLTSLATTRVLTADRVEALAREALTMQLTIGDELGAAMSLEAVAAIAVGSAGSGRAARLLAVADMLRDRLGAPALPSSSRADTYQALMRELSGTAFAAMTEEMRAMDLDTAIAIAFDDPA